MSYTIRSYFSGEYNDDGQQVESGSLDELPVLLYT